MKKAVAIIFAAFIVGLIVYLFVFPVNEEREVNLSVIDAEAVFLGNNPHQEATKLPLTFFLGKNYDKVMVWATNKEVTFLGEKDNKWFRSVEELSVGSILTVNSLEINNSVMTVNYEKDHRKAFATSFLIIILSGVIVILILD